MFLGVGLNLHNVSMSIHQCGFCKNIFTVTPAAKPNAIDDWDYCLAENCPSYDPKRDADGYFEESIDESNK
ncbi:MAG: hypothetical protein V3W19_08525 [Desulfatiglandales bacterium]